MDDYLARIATLLGPFPEPWWTTTWQTRGEIFKDELDSQGRTIDAHPLFLTAKPMMYSKTGELVPYQETRSIREELDNGACLDFFEALDASYRRDIDTTPFTPRDIPPTSLRLLQTCSRRYCNMTFSRCREIDCVGSQGYNYNYELRV